jgi:Chlorophyll A-B binding protein
MALNSYVGLSEGKTAGDIKKFREAELKHGRLAMTAFLGIMVAESFNPLFDGKISGAAIYQFQQADNLNSYFWVAVLFGIALVEGQNILTGWESSSETADRKSVVAQLKESYINGDLGFDPLGLTPDNSDDFDILRTKELNNGRLAMLAVAGIVAQELVNGKGVLENLGFGPELAVIQK